MYVTVDPERDDAERMRKYLAAFDPTFVGGTGTAERLAAVRKEYGIAATKHAAGTGYLVCTFVVHLPDRSRRASCAR